MYNRRRLKKFNLINGFILSLICIVMIIPMWKVVVESLSAKEFIIANKVFMWPKGTNFQSYWVVLRDKAMINAFKNSGFITIFGTVLNLIMTTALAYPLSRPEFIYKKPLLLMVVITMIFSPPLIPMYLTVQFLGLDNTIWAVILPGVISGFNFFILRSFFISTVPNEIIDSARLDGCSEINILIKIVVPISKAAFATIALFYAVDHWNSLFNPLIYLRDPKLQTIQLRLYQLVSVDRMDFSRDDMKNVNVTPSTLKMTSIMIATLPILMVYPFLQKYFVKGVMLGSVKD